MNLSDGFLVRDEESIFKINVGLTSHLKWWSDYGVITKVRNEKKVTRVRALTGDCSDRGKNANG